MDTHPTPGEIGIITVNYNSLGGLERTVESVLSQTEPVRFHVVDADSSDGSIEFLCSLGARPGFSFSSGPDGGPYHGMNIGARALDTEWLLFLNAGDWLVDAEAISRVGKALRGETSEIVCFGITTIARDGSRYEGRTQQPNLDRLSFYNVVYHQATLIRRRCLLRLGGFNTRYRFCADYDFFLACRELGARFSFQTETPLATFRKDGITSQGRHALAYYAEMVTIQRQHGLLGNWTLPLIGLVKWGLGDRLVDRLYQVTAPLRRSLLR